MGKQLALAIVFLTFMWEISAYASIEKEKTSNPPAAALIVDAQSGHILSAYLAEEKRFPASLTKLMTLYIMMREIEKGHLFPDTQMHVSAQAAKQPPSKLGLKHGDMLRADIAMHALVIKSANDVAHVVAEHISGSTAEFADYMNETARALGMKNTHFTNASGLHDENQFSTAYDIAIVSLALLHEFPQFTALWSKQSFHYNGKKYVTHNRLLNHLPGSIGMKTGYIKAAGYNIVTAMEYEDKMILTIIIGGKSAHMRDRIVKALAQGNFTTAQSWRIPDHIPTMYADLWLTPEYPTQQNITPLLPIAYENETAQGDSDVAYNEWSIQVGTYAQKKQAWQSLNMIARTFPAHFENTQARARIAKQTTTPLYHARFTGLSEVKAKGLCAILNAHNQQCYEITPD